MPLDLCSGDKMPRSSSTPLNDKDKSKKNSNRNNSKQAPCLINSNRNKDTILQYDSLNNSPNANWTTITNKRTISDSSNPSSPNNSQHNIKNKK